MGTPSTGGADLETLARVVGRVRRNIERVIEGKPDVVSSTLVVLLAEGHLLIEDPAAALATIREVLRPGGTLSLLVAQRHAAVVARAMAGHFQQALALLDPAGHRDGAHGRAGRRFSDDEARALLEGAGFEVVSGHGVRVFADLVPGSLLDLEPGATAALVELEHAVSERPEYLPLATQLHLLAR